MAGPTSAGLAAAIDGEDWIYVGSGGDAPAFETGWENSGTYADMAFRRNTLGDVRIFGAVLNNGGSGAAIVTLPEGYRPSAGRYGFFPVTVVTSLGDAVMGSVLVYDTGAVGLLFAGGDAGDTIFINGSFPVQPPAVTP